MKKPYIILILLIAVPTLFTYLTFTNSTDCDQLVIDTYELHSSINIPKVAYVNCYFDQKLNTRISIYDLRGTINLQDFKIVKATETNYLRGIKLLSEDERPQQTNLYLASGERWGTKWTYVVDKNSNRLWAELNY